MFNLIDIVIIAIVALSAFIGYKRGFVKTVISLLSFVIAIGVALAFYKPLSAVLIENTTIDDWISERIIQSNVELSGDQLIIEEKAQTDNIDIKIDEKTEENAENNDFLSNILSVLPSDFNKIIDLNETKELIKRQIADKIVELVINLLSLIIIFVLVKITLVIANILLGLATKVPGVKQVNEILGLILGIILALFEVYLAFAFILFISSVADISFVVDAIKSSLIGNFLFNNNPIIWFLS